MAENATLKLIRMNEVEAEEIKCCGTRISRSEKSQSYRATPATERQRWFWR